MVRRASCRAPPACIGGRNESRRRDLAAQPAASPQQAGEFMRRQRPAEVVSLNLEALMLPQKVQLFLALDPFGNHIEFQAVCDGDDGPGDGRGVGSLGKVLNEAAVDLDARDWKALEVREG